MTKLSAILVLIVVLQISWTPFTEGSRILVVFPPPAPSHFFLGNALVKELVKRGHDVTFISSFGSKLKEKNIKDVVIPGLVDRIEEKKKEMNLLADEEKSVISQMSQFITITKWMNAEVISNPETQKMLKSNAKFDLVIIESFMSEALVGFAHHYNCPLVVVSTVGANFWTDHFTGNQAPPSFVPETMTDFTGRMNFKERLTNFLIHYTTQLLYNWQMPSEDELLHKHFPTASPLEEIIRERTQLVLLNSHPSISPVKPLVPNMIEIGGYHIAEPKPLPKDLQTFLDNAKQGFILFSMGSNLKSNMLPKEKRELLMKVFAQLPYQILWKFEDDNMPNKPANVRIDKWLPQNDILAHPNLKLFITHGGLLSTTEAIYHGVPVVGIPVLGDQKMNMATAKKLGMGEYVPFQTLNYQDLLAAIQEVLNNKAYRQTAQTRSALFRDQPVKPLDSAMYWIEFVLRHKNLDHLKTGAIYLNWYQIHSLDVLAFLGSIVFGISTILYITVKKCCCRRKKNVEKIASKKRQ